MGVCVESALLSSLIAWSSANRMAAMGEKLVYDGICPGNSFSFGTELENRLLVEMSITRCTEHAQAYWWWLLWFHFGTCALFGWVWRIWTWFHVILLLFAIMVCFYKEWNKSSYMTGLFPGNPQTGSCWTGCYFVVIHSRMLTVKLLFLIFLQSCMYFRDIFASI